MMVLYDYNSKAILTEPLKSNTTSELVRAQPRLTQYLLDCGLKPTALRIDNECPEALKLFFSDNSIDFQLCPAQRNPRVVFQRFGQNDVDAVVTQHHH